MTASFAPAQPVGRFGVVVPVKRLAAAKTRLSPFGPDLRRLLGEAFLLDTLEAASAAALVTSVVVVTDDTDLAAAALRVAGPGLVSTLRDPQPGGLNAAFRAGAEHLADTAGVAGFVALCGDLPTMAPADLDAVLSAVPADGTAFVPDRQGTGTTTYAASRLDLFAPRFGVGSAANHATAGAVDLSSAATTRMRCDVDTPEDLDVAVGLGVGPHTAAALLRAGLSRPIWADRSGLTDLG